MDWTKVLLGLSFSAITVTTHAFEECGELRNVMQYGPYDYRTVSEDKKQLVETAHFLPFVESLQRGLTTNHVGGDIDYTLRAFPNHPRALLAMMKLGFKLKTSKPPGAHFTVECYFDRAIRFTPDDPAVHTFYGLYLVKRGDRQAAARELDTAREGLQTSGGDQNLNYNLGLAYFDLADYEKALQQAKLAYSLGFPLPGLREKLKRAGKWEE